jgi:prepilin-type processing-associated H-X9-DG protein
VPIIGGDNLHGLYSFHPGGVYVALVDGSVQFIHDSIETNLMFSLITRSSGEMVDLSNVF